MKRSVLLLAGLALVGAGCGEDDPVGPIDSLSRPRNLQVFYEWMFEGWSDSQPIGTPAVVLTWELPESGVVDAFRVFAAGGNQAGFQPIATVTSCADGLCRYTDVNVVPGTTYEYFVAVRDEDRNRDLGESTTEDVTVPVSTIPSIPDAPRAIALDATAYLEWSSVGAQFYVVYLEDNDSDALFRIGETDGTSFLDDRAENGVVSRYRIAGVDEFGHFSDLSEASSVVPRPDGHSALIYAADDNLALSGFEFVDSDGLDPVVSGDAASAHWRLEVIDGEWSIVPLGGVEVTEEGFFSTALTCGPAADPNCVSVDEAPESGYVTTPVPLDPESTYVFRIPAEGGVRFGKIRVQILGTAPETGHALLIFDWAYQLRVGDPNLNIVGDRG